jgi:hypothetical protein
MLRRVLSVGLLLSVMLSAQHAWADPVPDQPDCRRNVSTGECQLSVGDEPAEPGTGNGKKPVNVGESGCFFKGEKLPCRTADGFFDAASGCYLTPQDSPSTLTGDGTAYKPGTKFYRCWVILDVVDGRPEGIERFESVIREPGEPATMDPREAARQVVATMNFVAPHLGLSPYVQSATHEGIVNVPIWMWVTDPGQTTTGPQTKTATLGGVTIEARGTVERIEWSMGGGKVVTCEGPGTPFDRSAAAGKSLKDIKDSPTCGHRYNKTSRCEKGGSYQVSATAFWNVHWTGGGMEGDIPLDFTRSLPLRVTDLRPVLVDPGGDPAAVTPRPRSCP